MLAAFVAAVSLALAAAHAEIDVASARRALENKVLAFPVKGYERALRDNFDERRGSTPHEALDIMAPRGTPVVAADNGTIAKLFKSVPGGITIYQFDESGAIAYYYAHLDRYETGLKEGDRVRRGEVIGYVGSTGNARADAPHLHFTVYALGADRKWWKGTAINPYAALSPR
jgi:murein DD-endopeptidase MepM/ murein hydrolase activator NlpD